MKNPSKGLLINTIYLLVSGQLSRVINFFQVIMLVRYLGKHEYGIWNLSQSLPSMFFVLTDLGLNSILLRRISRDKHLLAYYFMQVLFLKLILSSLFLLSIYIYVETSHYEADVKYLVYMSAIAYLISSFAELIITVYRSLEDFLFESIINTVKSAVFLLIVVFVILYGLRLWGLVSSLLLLNILISLFCIIWYTRKHHSIRFKINEFKIYAGLIKEALPFASLSLFLPIFFQIDIIMLSRLSTYESVGIYSAPYKIILMLFVIPDTLRRVLFPRLSALYTQSSERYKITFNKTYLITILLAIPISVGLFILADKIILLLFSSEYIESIVPLRIMSIYLFLYYLRSLFSVSLYASNFERSAIIIFGFATVLNGVLDYMLIPKYDYVGAALASLFAELPIFISYYLYIRKDIFTPENLKAGLKISCSAIIMGISLLLSYNHSVYIQIPVGVVVYGMSVHLFKVFNNEEYNAIKQLLRI